MRKLLLAILLLTMVVLGAGQALAYEGCAALAKQLKEKGLIDANNEAAIANECRGKEPTWNAQCRSACDSSTAGSPRGVGIGCHIGCVACTNTLKNN